MKAGQKIYLVTVPKNRIREGFWNLGINERVVDKVTEKTVVFKFKMGGGEDSYKNLFGSMSGGFMRVVKLDNPDVVFCETIREAKDVVAGYLADYRIDLENQYTKDVDWANRAVLALKQLGDK